MLPAIWPSTKAIGFWAAVMATAFAITYDVAQIGEWLGWMDSGGGAENPSTYTGIIVLLTPSLFLGSSFLLTMVAVHDATEPERKVWTSAALVFSTLYAALISITYFVQLAWVAPRLAAGRTAGMEQFLFVPFDSFLYAVDILGYSFMSVATLLAAMAFTGPGVERIARRLLIANGLLLPCIALQMYWHGLLWVAALWAVTFPGATWAVAVHFRRVPAVPTTHASGA